MRGAAITVSTSKAAGEGADASGPLLAEIVRKLGGELAGSEVVADDRAAIAACLRRWCDDERCDLVLTSGGTGMSPTDVTPEATLDVLERQAPGLAEAMRLASRPHTPHWMLSRAVAGTRGRTLVINLPGHPRALSEVTDALLPALGHALELLSGSHGSHD
ncbi:MAG TPA: MogA/MoaB family molybdenum cofactor biosynthesis protein [Solirubrobacteraceae bacterium]|nr:MogA/MoaB family molybdenum cofactor biosynthesis protein [Solirubrobacteraceae bacterium]